MKKAKIYIPNKNPMQSGLGKSNKWLLEFETKDPTKNPLIYTSLYIEKINKYCISKCFGV